MNAITALDKLTRNNKLRCVTPNYIWSLSPDV